MTATARNSSPFAKCIVPIDRLPGVISTLSLNSTRISRMDPPAIGGFYPFKTHDGPKEPKLRTDPEQNSGAGKQKAETMPGQLSEVFVTMRVITLVNQSYAACFSRY
jgi:hypothetical protein